MTEIDKAAVHVRQPLKEMEVMVADVIRETHDAVTLVLFTGNDRLVYRAGNFLTVDPHQFESLRRFTDHCGHAGHGRCRRRGGRRR